MERLAYSGDKSFSAVGVNDMKPSAVLGFSLIELMVVVALVGLLAAIAYPSYQDFIRRGHRSQAISVLNENAQFLERNFTQANRYDQDSAGNAIILPFNVSPKEGQATYGIALDPGTLTATTYSLVATPRAGSIMQTDPCGVLTLNNLGQKGVGGLDVATCWNR